MPPPARADGVGNRGAKASAELGEEVVAHGEDGRFLFTPGPSILGPVSEGTGSGDYSCSLSHCLRQTPESTGGGRGTQCLLVLCS